MARILPEEENFDPDSFDEQDAREAFRTGVTLFNDGEYHAAHEEIENCWLATESNDADFFKGLIQAAIALHHFRRDNLEGARKLYSGHRRLLGKYMPQHRGVDVEGFLTAMQVALRPALRPDSQARYDFDARPLIRAAATG